MKDKASRSTENALGSACTCAAVWLAAALAVWAVPARADERFEVQRFHPRPSQASAYLSTQGSELLAPGFWAVSLLYNHGATPLSFSNSRGESLGRVVQSMGSADVLAAFGVTQYLELGVGLPLVLYQHGEPLPSLVTAEDSEPGAGIGDLRLMPTVAFPNWELGAGQRLGAAFTLNLSLPTGERQGFQGGGLAVEPRLAVEYLTPALNVAMNAGYLLRDDAELLYLEVDDALTWGVACRVPLAELVPVAVVRRSALQAVAELHGEVSVLAQHLETEEAPMEALVGLRAVLGKMAFNLAAGTGLIRGYGTPSWRVVAGVSFMAGGERAAAQGDTSTRAAATLATQPAAASPGQNGFGSCSTTDKGQVVCAGELALDDLVVYFASDSAVLLPESVAALREAVRRLATHPQVAHVWVEGHADDRDSHDYNVALSRKRAEEVQSQLVRAGINPERLTATGFSASQHLATGQSELAQALNKRVEFRIAPKSDQRGTAQDPSGISLEAKAAAAGADPNAKAEPPIR